MNHRTLGILSAILASASLFASAAEGMITKPNILLIIADDMGYSDITCFGGEVQTPHIDTLKRLIQSHADNIGASRLPAEVQALTQRLVA